MRPCRWCRWTRAATRGVFRTLQDRVPKALALAEITMMAAANRYLAEHFLPAYNRRVAWSMADPGTAFVPWIGTHLAEMRCLQEARVVANDNMMRNQGLHLQIPPDRHRFPYVAVTIRVHAYPAGTLAVLHGPRCVARYQPNGRVIESEGAPPRRCGSTRRSGDRPIVDPQPTGGERISMPG